MACDYGFHTSKWVAAESWALTFRVLQPIVLIMFTVAVLEVLGTVLLGAVERSTAVASDRLVGGKPKLQQLEAAIDILQGKDVLVSLPAGYRKTLIYQLLLIAAREILLMSKATMPHDPIVLVLSPLISLMEDQVKRCSRLGLTDIHLTPSNCQEHSV